MKLCKTGFIIMFAWSSICETKDLVFAKMMLVIIPHFLKTQTGIPNPK